jgi:2-keto-4-pentenoate hydratase/2-oxohepta-3-ene-1,7-dioic acid hydratase in catechol pathway
MPIALSGGFPMSFTRYLHDGAARIGRLDGDRLVPWSSATLAAALLGGGEAAGPAIAAGSVRSLPTLDPHAKILCVALNYVNHAAEAKQPIPETPILFFKSREAMIAAGDAIQMPPAATQIDYEGELAIVIGRAAYGISAAQAWDHIAGVMPFNDGSARNLLNVAAGSKTHLDWFSAKCLQSSTPIGPAVAPLSTVRDDLAAQRLWVTTRVNGEVRQNASIADMIFDIPTIVAFAASRVTDSAHQRSRRREACPWR